MIYIFCNDCKHIKLCKHYEYLCRYPELTIFSCSLKEPKHSLETTVKPSINPNDNIVPLKMVKKEKENEEYEPPELKLCPNCGAKTYGEIYKCSECGIPICDCCGYYGDTELSNEGTIEIDKYYCGECYDKLFSEDIEDVDDTSIFEMLTSDFESESDEDGNR